MRIIKLELPNLGFYVLVEARIGTPEKLETVWIRINGTGPVSEEAADQHINYVKNVLCLEADIIEYIDLLGVGSQKGL